MKVRFDPLTNRNRRNGIELVSTGTSRFVNISMVTYNRLEFTKEVIHSIADHTSYPYVLTVVDNGSTDESREYLIETQKEGIIKNLVLLGNNVGVAKASNLAWHLEPLSAYYVKFDNDIVIRKKGWLSNMVSVIEGVPGLGAVAYNFEPISYPLSTASGMKIRIKRGTLGGACILIPNRTREILGYWSEEYGLYGEEDLDYGFRILHAKMLNAYMEDEDIGEHLPAGKAASIEIESMTASDGVEEWTHGEYRKWKDARRRKNVSLLGRFNRNKLLYKWKIKPLYIASQFSERILGIVRRESVESGLIEIDKNRLIGW
jgi:glycosyltransferase involved in cell wall biosynthesis